MLHKLVLSNSFVVRSNRVFIYMLFSFLCIALFPAMLQANVAESSDKQTGRQQLVIASSNNFPPINILGENGPLTGFARDLSSAVARAIGVEVAYKHSGVWPNVLKMLETGSADLIHDTGYTSERDAYLDFTVPIIEMPESIFVREQQFDIQHISSLNGKKVACVNGHITHLYLQNFKGIQCHLVNTPAEGLVALINGNVDAFIYPQQIVRYLAQQLKLAHKIKVVGEPLRVLSWSMTVKQGNRELVEQLNRGIEAVKESGEYQRIYDKWFGRRLFAGYSQDEVFIIAIAAVSLSLLIAIMAGLLLYTRGITSVNRALVESENKYRTLADELPESIFLKDIDLNYVSCNQRYADSLGIKPEEIAGKSDYDFYQENVEDYRAGDRMVMELGETREFIESCVEDGKKIIINTIKTPVYNDAGELKGVLGIFWDITEERNIKDRLANTISEYNAITATVPDIMFKLDNEGNFTWWNESLERTIDLQSSSLKNEHILNIVVEQDREIVDQAMQATIKNGYGEIEARLCTHNGELIFNINGAKLLDDEGMFIGFVGSGRDVSKQKESELQQQELQHQLIQAQKMEAIGQLTGGIAHDFNNMLAVILGYGELTREGLKSGKSEQKLDEYLLAIVRSSSRARDLVTQMMTFARGQKGTLQELVVADMVSEAVNMLRPMLPTTIELKWQVDDQLPSLMADPVMLQQMLVNLCINARDAMQKHGQITIQAREVFVDDGVCISCHGKFNGSYIELSVTDSGTGIEPELISQIFQPFVTTKNVGEGSGSGMGLAMVHGITHEHRGHIKLESRPGNTQFSIYLPTEDIIASENEPEEEIIHTVIQNDEQQHHILVVDDEFILCELLREVLMDEGYKVSVENNAISALSLFKSNPERYDLVITDQTMPEMTGSEMAIEMLKLKEDLPIIISTGHSDKSDEDSARVIGIKAFLKKPVDMKQLLETVQKLLNNQTI